MFEVFVFWNTAWILHALWSKCMQVRLNNPFNRLPSATNLIGRPLCLSKRSTQLEISYSRTNVHLYFKRGLTRLTSKQVNLAWAVFLKENIACRQNWSLNWPCDVVLHGTKIICGNSKIVCPRGWTNAKYCFCAWVGFRAVNTTFGYRATRLFDSWIWILSKIFRQYTRPPFH